MIASILKKDLKRKKTMNIIILIFVILSVMFVASSVSNIVTVMNGTDYFFDKAGMGDYGFVIMGEESSNAAKEALEGSEIVKEYHLEDSIFIDISNLFAKGKELEGSSPILQSLSKNYMKLFDENNEVVDKVEKGYVYLTGNIMAANNLEVGDELTVKVKDVEKCFKIKGKLKDAVFGSSLMGNIRVLISDEDFEAFVSNEDISNHLMGKIGYVFTDKPEEMGNVFSDVTGVVFSAPRSLFKLTYIMYLIVAGILIVLSVSLIIVSFVVLKFTITFTIEEEFREIGVMKAIGIKDKKIRKIYVIKYLALSILGAVIGFILSFPFASMLMKSVSENMVLGNDTGSILNIVSSVVIVLIIVSYAYHCTKKLNKFTPIDAIRSGQTGERYKKKSKLRIGKSRLKTTSYMAVNDIASSPKRYITIILAFTICSLLVFMILNTVETLKSGKLVHALGKVSDVYCTDWSMIDDVAYSEDIKEYDKVISKFENILKEEGMDANVTIEMQIVVSLNFDGKTFSTRGAYGYGSKSVDYVYDEGTAPSNKYEIAITKDVSELSGAHIGDKVQLSIGGKEEEYLVTAYMQSMNNAGNIIRLHEDAEFERSEVAGHSAINIDFKDSPSKKEIDSRIEKMKEVFGTDRFFNAAEFANDVMGVAGILEGVELLLLAITLIVVALVTILMERSFISDEKGEIAILKAIGFRDSSVVRWHLVRFIIIGLLSELIAVFLSVPATNLCITPLFGMMGMHKVEYEYNWLKLLLIMPAIILSVTVISAWLTSLYTKKINCRDTASIE